MKKQKTKTKTESRGRSEILETQLAFEVSRQMFPTREKAEAARDRAVRHFLKTGHSIAGVKIVARWRNPENSNARHAAWKTTEQRGHSLEDFFLTLHKSRGALRRLAERYL